MQPINKKTQQRNFSFEDVYLQTANIHENQLLSKDFPII